MLDWYVLYYLALKEKSENHRILLFDQIFIYVLIWKSLKYDEFKKYWNEYRLFVIMFAILSTGNLSAFGIIDSNLFQWSVFKV